ncbi:MAG: hypothetical protein IT442_12495 [Phycisphaeraceae bacterium]|nr:hypothetical protein [Phycisphaeraceae bacterium]
MNVTTSEFEAACRAHLDRFFAEHPASVDQLRAYKALRLLRAGEKPLRGKAEGWAAGIIYAVATDGRFPCGVPGVLNAEFEQLMGVTMSTVRYRAARVMELVTL